MTKLCPRGKAAAKRKRGGKMRKKGAKGAPKASDFKRAKQTAKA